MTTIGVFDSGVGGLTVLRALLPLLPSARYIYLGDTARLPYGSKSRETIARYAVSSARFLVEQGADLLVIACNTASALALEEMRQAVAPIPVIGVIAPGAAAAAVRLRQQESSTDDGPARVLVLATTATVQAHAYSKALASVGLAAIEKACPLLVPLIEEGWTDHPVTREVARIYLGEALEQSPGATTMVLGCTHYPLIRDLLEKTLAGIGRPLVIIDSAEATARAVLQHLGEAPAAGLGQPECAFYATDSVEKFQLLGSKFLGQPLPEVNLIDLGG